MSSITLTLGTNVENLTLTGTSAIAGTGNAVANLITGNGADNLLSGLGGADTLIGGLGNDSYVVNSVSDVLYESANAGNDSVTSSTEWFLGDNFEIWSFRGWWPPMAPAMS